LWLLYWVSVAPSHVQVVVLVLHQAQALLWLLYWVSVAPSHVQVVVLVLHQAQALVRPCSPWCVPPSMCSSASTPKKNWACRCWVCAECSRGRVCVHLCYACCLPAPALLACACAHQCGYPQGAPALHAPALHAQCVCTFVMPAACLHLPRSRAHQCVGTRKARLPCTRLPCTRSVCAPLLRLLPACTCPARAHTSVWVHARRACPARACMHLILAPSPSIQAHNTTHEHAGAPGS